MENEKIICNDCSTENEQKYDYCKNCGAKLNKGDKEPSAYSFSTHTASTENTEAQNFNNNSGNTYNQNPNFQQNYTDPNFNQQSFGQNNFNHSNTFVESINGIPYGEVATFVGKESNKYMPVFSRLEITGRKAAWHWPCALLSFFLGPLGVSLWYFYRKMYKHAAIFATLGAVLSVISTLIIGPAEASEDIFELYSSFLNGVFLENPLSSEGVLKYEIINLLSGLIELVLTIICGLFTHNWYKEHICKSIFKYRTSNVDVRYYQMGLMSLGGTSGGMLALGFAIMFFVENISTVIFAALAAIGG